MKANRPGEMHSIDGRMSPDLQTAFHIYSSHWRKVNARWQYPEHTHPSFEINVVLQGSQHMVVNGRSYVQESGDILFIRPGVTHSSLGTRNGGEMTYYCLHFDIDDLVLRRALLTLDAVSLGGEAPELAAIRSALDSLIASAILSEAEGAKRSRMQTLQATLGLFSALCGWALAGTADDPRMARPGASENTVALASAIEGLLQESVFTAAATGSRGGGIESIAARLGYSTNHCNRVFQQIFGMSPRQYLSDLIIRHAKLLLLDNSLSVETIALRLGYRDVSHFSKQFKRWTGRPPMGFRRLTAEQETGGTRG
ncbi:AraC family transcriptional regulator [Paenibacillus tengchongensis]|uniref:AraC family transcriptional regulator n=1 Tax=Paenibacillus tengchongensis TaxID=2608684 RepID=UPI001652673B|nr:helix-turn-helix domain-containing protein [Paenibacillus tengchongensis]